MVSFLTSHYFCCNHSDRIEVKLINYFRLGEPLTTTHNNFKLFNDFESIEGNGENFLILSLSQRFGDDLSPSRPFWVIIHHFNFDIWAPEVSFQKWGMDGKRGKIWQPIFGMVEIIWLCLIVIKVKVAFWFLIVWWYQTSQKLCLSMVSPQIQYNILPF